MTVNHISRSGGERRQQDAFHGEEARRNGSDRRQQNRLIEAAFEMSDSDSGRAYWRRISGDK